MAGAATRSWPCVAPYTWMTAAFPDHFTFTIAAHDDPALDPEWKNDYAVTMENAFKDGWIYHNGQFDKVKAVSNITERNRQTLAPVSHHIPATTESGQHFVFVGKVVSVAPMTVWHNNLLHVGLTRWTCDQIMTCPHRVSRVDC